MSIKQTDTSNDRLNKSGPDILNKKDRSIQENERDADAEDIHVNYGFARDAELDTHAEETKDREYLVNGLPRTARYTVDKVGRSHDELGGHNRQGNCSL